MTSSNLDTNYNNNQELIPKHIGNNITFFNNKIILGPKKMLPLFLACLLLFCVTELVFLVYISNLFYEFIYINQLLFFILCLFFFIRCFIEDPGIIPRSNIKLNKNEESEDNIKSKKGIFSERECYTCNIIRPPGASHCRICDNCVLNFDQ